MKHHVRDRDRIYGDVAMRRIRAMGIRDKPIASASPWQNGFAEWLIGSIRRECLDHLVILGEAHLRRILRTYAGYYNEIRTHWSNPNRLLWFYEICWLAKYRVDHPPHGITLCRELIAVAVAQIDRDPVVRDRLV
jgi:transposase InsO family protein